MKLVEVIKLLGLDPEQVRVTFNHRPISRADVALIELEVIALPGAIQNVIEEEGLTYTERWPIGGKSQL